MSKSLTLLLALALLVPATDAQQNSAGFKASESSAPFVAKPCFDYTRLQEPDPVWYKRLESSKYTLENAIVEAVGGREDVRATGARMITQPRAYYQIEIMRKGSIQFETLRLDPNSGKPITGEFPGEPCFYHGDLAPADLNKALFNAVVPLEEAVVFGVNKFNHGAFTRQVTFIGQGKDRRHELEVFSSHKNGQNRRWHMVIPGNRAAMRMRIMQAQWAGEPLKPEDSPTDHESGVKTYDFIVGDGELIEADSLITAHYRLVLLDNQAIFNSKLAAKPVTFRVEEAQLEGLKLGLKGMRVGGKRKIIMPAELAFGSRGKGQIPPNAIVVADIGVLSMVDEGE